MIFDQLVNENDMQYFFFIQGKGRWGHLWTKFRKHFLKSIKYILFTTSGIMLKGQVFHINEICSTHKIKSHFYVINIFLWWCIM